MEWYTKQEVAEKLGISESIVYLYARQGKIKKIEDLHRIHRKARYQRKEVDDLASRLEAPSGVRPSELAKRLKIPVKRVYTLLKEHELPVDEFPIGDERIGYSISEEVATRLEEIVAKNLSARGTPTDFYNSQDDIAIYQLFISKNGQELRVIKNEEQEWGFYMTGRIWVPFKEAREQHDLAASYGIHRPNVRPEGYIDFSLPKESFITYDFIDFVYRTWGIENVRLRELEAEISLSIKSGEWKKVPLPESLTMGWIASHTVAGNIEEKMDTWVLLSGQRKTTIQLPDTLLAKIVQLSKEQGKTMSEYIEEAVQLKVNKDTQN